MSRGGVPDVQEWVCAGPATARPWRSSWFADSRPPLRGWPSRCARGRAGTVFRVGCIGGGGVGWVEPFGATAEPGDGFAARRSAAGAGRYAGDARQSLTGEALTADGRFLWTVSAGVGNNDVRIVNTATHRVCQILPVPGASGGIALDSVHRLAYVSGLSRPRCGYRRSSRCWVMAVTTSWCSAGRVSVGRRVRWG